MSLKQGPVCDTFIMSSKGLRQRRKDYKNYLQRGYDFMKKYEERFHKLDERQHKSKLSYVPGDDIAGDSLRIFDDRPIITPPLVCQLCDVSFISENDVKHHMADDHGGENEYRKRVLYLMTETGHRPITGQEKRIMVQNFAHFQQWCFPGSRGNYFADTKAVPRCEAACVVCAQKDYLVACKMSRQ